MDIVVFSTGPERKEVVQRPGELITGMGVDGLEKASNDPEIHGEDVEVSSQETPEDGGAHSAETKDHYFDWRGILSGQTKRS